MSEIIAEHIDFKRIRPRIRVETDLSPIEIIETIRTKLKEDDSKCVGTVLPGFAIISPLLKDQHFWSPQLTINVEELENSTLVRGLYGPKASVWTMFVFFYSFIGFLTMIALMVGLSFWSLDKPTTILWLVPILILVFLSLYLVAFFGQKLGQKQMTNLHRFMEQCLGMELEAF